MPRLWELGRCLGSGALMGKMTQSFVFQQRAEDMARAFYLTAFSSLKESRKHTFQLISK